ncbi:hypothetical protein CVT25_009520 [Psilocybe cyanescens]|uniref:Uncharacterized protein n=1 Tax=Psilocybe cyanescens TaxID=93625 RepID=A0A409WWT4_PSICY|nr:hypothetical protein CVT25_009520 [Psilocybe cyanescens]
MASNPKLIHIQRQTDFHVVPNDRLGDTAVSEVLSNYGAELENKFSLKDGEVNGTFIDAIPYVPRWTHIQDGVIVPRPAQPTLTMEQIFGRYQTGLLMVPTTKPDEFRDTHREVVRLTAVNELLTDDHPSGKKVKRNRHPAQQTLKDQGNSPDIQDLYGMMDKLLDKTKKLETETESWRRKTEDLEATVKHMKGELANTQQELEFVKESTADTTEWITEGCPSDSIAFRRIKLRNLLDRVQAKLAYYASFTDGLYTRYASLEWRTRLRGSNTSERIKLAREFLQRPEARGHNNPALVNFLASKDAMRLAVQQNSILRMQADQVVHSNLPRKQISEAVQDHVADGGTDEVGLNVFVEFLFAP